MWVQWMRRGVLLSIIAGFSSGCMMYRLEELRNTTPQGTPFQTELSHIYMDFAARKEKAYDWNNSWYFADKGLRLAYGKDAEPEELEGWNLDDASRMELEKMRIRVMDTLTPALKDSAPERAAAIEFNFDCWVVYQEGGWQNDEIEDCREGLLHALHGTIEDRDADIAPVKKSKPTKWAKHTQFVAPTSEVMDEPEKVIADKSMVKAPIKGPAVKEMATETASYAVFFEVGKPVIAEPGKNVLNEVLGLLKNKSGYKVVIHGGPSNGPDQEKDLPAERITVVKNMLTDGGVPETAIVSADAPEANELVARRVELFLNE